MQIFFDVLFVNNKFMMVAVNHLGDAGGLVGGQRIHRVDENRLHPLVCGIGQAVVQDGQQEALGLTRACTRGHKGGLLSPATQL